MSPCEVVTECLSRESVRTKHLHINGIASKFRLHFHFQKETKELVLSLSNTNGRMVRNLRMKEDSCETRQREGQQRKVMHTHAEKVRESESESEREREHEKTKRRENCKYHHLGVARWNGTQRDAWRYVTRGGIVWKDNGAAKRKREK